jgi:glutathione S-transferase
MILYYSSTNPYVRKVLACIIARDIDWQIEKILVDPHQTPAALIAQNPLSKVPCLVTDDRLSLFDSRVICEYLDSVGEELPLFPPPGAARWMALHYQALADGMVDAAVLRRKESQKTRDLAQETFMARQKSTIDRVLEALDENVPTSRLDIGSISVACALGYLDFRCPEEPWRESYPQLAKWYTSMAAHRAIAATGPD